MNISTASAINSYLSVVVYLRYLIFIFCPFVDMNPRKARLFVTANIAQSVSCVLLIEYITPTKKYFGLLHRVITMIMRDFYKALNT